MRNTLAVGWIIFIFADVGIGKRAVLYNLPLMRYPWYLKWKKVYELL